MTRPFRPNRLLAAGRVFAVATAVLAGTAGASSDALAVEPQLINTFGAWTAYTFEEKSGKVCYMASQPKKAEGDYTSRGDIFALVTHRPGEDSLNVVSIVAGYPYKENSEVELTIGNKTFTLFTQGDRAWARTAKADAEITEAIRKGSEMVVKGTSSRGTLTTDTYSLRGSNNAYEAISRACNVSAD